jgi:hypothetical protein
MEENTRPARPSKVTLALYILYFNLAIVLIRLLGPLLRFGARDLIKSEPCFELIKFGLFIKLIVIAPIAIWFYILIGNGENWVRITLLVLVILGVPLSILNAINLGHSQNDFFAYLELQQAALQVVAMALLFQPESSQWFQAMKEGTAPAGSEDQIGHSV